LVLQQDQWAQAQGQVAQGLIQVYRSLGGGWQIRLGPPAGAVAAPDAAAGEQPAGGAPRHLPPVPEPIPVPQ
ncbi:MAG: transporter, partial [Planctomycetes bacterium]|nr:transporter [Planctomycetota bacterium]